MKDTSRSTLHSLVISHFVNELILQVVRTTRVTILSQYPIYVIMKVRLRSQLHRATIRYFVIPTGNC